MPSKQPTQLLKIHLSHLKHDEEEQLARDLAAKLKLTYVDLSVAPVNVDDMAILPREKAEKGKLVIMRKLGGNLQVAVKDPNDGQTKKIIEELEEQGYKCQFLIASLSGLKAAWEKYKSKQTKRVPLRNVLIIQKNNLKSLQTSIKTIQELKKEMNNISTTDLLTIIIAGANQVKASDIHIEPTAKNVRLRYRIDGVLQDIADFPTKAYQLLLSRIKNLSDMLLNVHDISQDGRFSIRIMDGEKILKETDARVSVLPSAYAETLVIRILGTEAASLDLKELGLRPELLKLISNQISRPHGMILNTGPTGSGKTTTLYACLNYINKPGRKIITVEDPIEYLLEGITQTQINSRKGQTFAQSLKAIVRQDPDILMIGEIRDEESAEIAVRFALTGHIVFSTLHTNDASGAIVRLSDMGIKESLIASTLNLAIAQRLVRRLCPHCKMAYRPEKKVMENIKKILSLISPKTGVEIPKKITTLYKAKGCAKCHGLGYKGRIGVFEFLTISPTIKKLILAGSVSSDLQAKAVKEGMLTLEQDAMLRAAEGITSLEEVQRVIGLPLS